MPRCISVRTVNKQKMAQAVKNRQIEKMENSVDKTFGSIETSISIVTTTIDKTFKADDN